MQPFKINALITIVIFKIDDLILHLDTTWRERCKFGATSERIVAKDPIYKFDSIHAIRHVFCKIPG